MGKLSSRTEFVKPTFQTSVNLEGYINIGSGTPNFSPPESVIQAFKESIDRRQLSYTSWSGLHTLKEAISKKLLKENNYFADPAAEILVTSGAQPAIFAIFLSILDYGDEVIIPAPYYSTYEEIAKICGAKVIPIQTNTHNNFTFSFDDFEQTLSEKTKLVVLVSPSNPTGTVLSKDLIDKVYNKLEGLDITLITDEIYEHYIYDDYKHYSLMSEHVEKKNIISIYSLSKGYGLTGIRVGYIVSNRDMIATIAPFHHAMNICAPVNAQYASIEALSLGREWFEIEMRNVTAARQLWIDFLEQLNLPYGIPQGAYYVCFDIGECQKSAPQVSKDLRSGHQLIINSVEDKYLRGSFMQDLEVLKSGLNRLKSYFR